ncbi:MAG: hypothetical protein ACE5L6_02105 [Candidatus Bathyarchaeia archaeon]
MSMNQYREYVVEQRGIPWWVWVLGVVTGVGVIGYLFYRYFIHPGDVILDQYQAILEDIYKETKQFLTENEQQGIYGLTAEQEAILAGKQKAADDLRPTVERIIFERGWQLWSWFQTIAIGIVVALALRAVQPTLKELIKKWRSENPEASQNIASQYGHGHLMFELVANEFALAGKTGIASAFYTGNIPHIYTSYTQANLNSQIAFYQNLIPTLVPGTIEYIVAQQMLNYFLYEVSTITGIMPVLHTWWLPPGLP